MGFDAEIVRMEAARPSLRRRVYIALEGGQAGGIWGSLIEGTLVALIVLNVVAYTLQSVPSIERIYGHLLGIFEFVSVAIFTLEYALRLWTSVEDPSVERRGALGGRLHTAAQPMMVIDFIAIAPAYVTLFMPFIDLRWLRLIRLLRLLKIARYSPALSTLAQVIVDERRALVGTLLLFLCAVVFAGATMHAVEGAVQPNLFGTIPDSMWWSVSTLTTVGYGDAVPVTPLGRIVAGLTMIVGMGLFALPVGVVATGFIDTIHRRDFVVTFGMLARVPLFRDFDTETIGELMTLLRAQSVRPGAIISAEGERAAAMYFVVAGEIEAQLPGHRLRFGAGDFFGELALLHETMRAATIVSIAPSRLLTLTSEDFDRMLAKHPSLKARIQKLAAKRASDIAEAGGISRTEMDAARKASG